MIATPSRRRAWARLAAIEWPLIVVAAPALLFPTPPRLLLALVVPLAWLGAWRSGGRLIPATPLNVSLIGLLVMTGVSLWATFDVLFSLGKVAGVVLGVFVFWAGARWTTSAARLQAAIAVFLAAGATLAVLGLLGSNWIGKFPGLAAAVAVLPKVIRGVPGAEEGFQPNAVAGCLVLFVPLQAALLFSGAPIQLGRRRLPQAVHALGLLLTAGTLVLTQSRGAAAGLLVAGFAALLWLGRRPRVLAASAIVIAVVLILALGPGRVVRWTIRQAGAGMAHDISGRMELWSRALYGIEDFPFTGMGMNAFRKVMPALYPTFSSPPDTDVAHAHNHLLQAALDLGLPGLVCYVALWLGAAGLLVRVYRGSGDRDRRVVAGGLGAGLIAHFAFGMTDAIPLGAKVGVLFWLTLALVVSLHQVARTSEGVTQSVANPERR